jgi:retron-type reverse transcriptase
MDALYDKVYREDVLFHAWRLAKANAGSAGVDGQTFSDIEDYGVERWLGELAEDLRKKTYRPQPVRFSVSPSSSGRLMLVAR